MIYKNWSYKFFIYTIILNIIVAFLVIQSTVFNNYAQQINVCAIIAAVFLILGIIFGIISYNKKEETDYKKKLGLFGNIALLILSIIFQFFGNV